MVLPQFQYKDRLDLSDRLAIAQTYVRFEGHHGLVIGVTQESAMPMAKGFA